MSARKTRRGVPLWPVMTLADVVARDGPLCPHCGRPANQRQHRANRGAGGSNERERPSNIIAFCDLNTALEQDAALAAWARDAGWKLRSTDDPTRVAYWDHPTQAWVLLDDHGGRRIVAGRDDGPVG